MLDLDLKVIKNELAEHLKTVEQLRTEQGDSFSTKKRVEFRKLDFSLTDAFNKVNEILNMGDR